MKHQPRHIKWVLIWKLSMSPFSQQPQKPCKRFFPISIYPARLCSETQPGTPSLSYIKKACCLQKGIGLGQKRLNLFFLYSEMILQGSFLLVLLHFSVKWLNFQTSEMKSTKPEDSNNVQHGPQKWLKMSTCCLFREKIVNFE